MTLKSRLRLALRRKEKKPISHQPKTSKLQNGEIPAEILDLVYEQLPTLDQIYFALTCKYLYIYFVSFLKVKDLDHAKHLIPREERLPIRHNAELKARPRIQLLRQLENKRWKCCVECMNLHPRSAFKSSRQSKKESHDCYKCGPLHSHDCMPFAGLVDICPCLRMTFNERQLVVNATPSTAQGILPEDFEHDPSLGVFLHDCEVISYLDAQVAIKTVLMTRSVKGDPKSKSLYVGNAYDFEFPKGLPGALSGICPHKETKKWLRQFFIETGLNYSVGEIVMPLGTEPHLIKILTARNLGYRNWNKRGWKNNRNDREWPWVEL